jgi:hypothetical protein
MQKSKLLNTIKILTIEDLDNVKNLLKSEMILKGAYRKECENLLSYILLYFGDFENKDLNKEEVVGKIFEKTTISVNRLEKTMSALLNVIEFYLVHFYDGHKKDEVNHDLAISRFYRENTLQQRSEVFVTDAENILKADNNILDVTFFYQKSMVVEERHVLSLLNNLANNEDAYLNVILQFREFAIVKELELIFKTVYNLHVFSPTLIELINKLSLEIEAEERFHENELIRLYKNAIAMFQYHKEDSFYEYYELYLSNLSIFDSRLEEKTRLQFATAQRVCLVYRYNYQMNKYNMTILFDTYKEHLELNYIIQSNRIFGSIATNMVIYATKLGQNEWAKYFLETYNTQIGYLNENQEEIVQLCWSIYYFANKEYEYAEKNILPKYANIYNTLIVRRMRIKIYYETDELDLIVYEIESFKQFVYRHFDKKEINEDHYDANRLFLDRLKQILKLKFNPNQTKKEKLKEKILGQKCSDQDWLIEKANNIKI